VKRLTLTILGCLIFSTSAYARTQSSSFLLQCRTKEVCQSQCEKLQKKTYLVGAVAKAIESEQYYLIATLTGRGLPSEKQDLDFLQGILEQGAKSGELVMSVKQMPEALSMLKERSNFKLLTDDPCAKGEVY
jgi:hypothetical protein